MPETAADHDARLRTGPAAGTPATALWEHARRTIVGEQPTAALGG